MKDVTKDIFWKLMSNFQYLEKLDEPHNDLPFLPVRMKTERVLKLLANLYDRTLNFIHIRN